MLLNEIFAVVMDFRKTIPVNVRELARKLGIQIIEIRLDNKTSGLLKRISEEKFVININSEHPETRKRFTIAHEIAHFVLHKYLLKIGDEIEDNAAYRAEGTKGNTLITQAHETDANKFAANLLMPPEKLIEEIDKGVTDVEELAGKFNVSVSSMEIRAGKLIKAHESGS